MTKKEKEILFKSAYYYGNNDQYHVLYSYALYGLILELGLMSEYSDYILNRRNGGE